MIEQWVGINEEEWIKHIDSLKSKGKSSKEDLKKIIINAVKKRIPKKRFGILFSGGVDSSLIALICKQAGVDFICYTIGYGETARDVEWAKKVAEKLDLNLKIKILSFDEAKKYIIKTAKLLGEI
jgi:asparagine synthase (glutamine-hydrolysing)